MKKRIITAAVILGGALLFCIVAGRILGYWQFFKIPSPSNEPGIKAGSHAIVSNLKKPGRNHFVAFSSYATDSMSFPEAEQITHSIYLSRLCALPGDILEMKNGTLYVNNKNFDADLDLYNQYKISNKYIDLVDQEDVYANDHISQLLFAGGDSVIVTFNRALKNKYAAKIDLVPYLSLDTAASSGVFKWYKINANWTVDNFGPLEVTTGNCFLLGDNRHNALDSRYTGFVSMKDITGVLIYKY